MALLLTNIFLIGTYLIQSEDWSNSDGKMEQVTIDLLKDKNIILNTNMPDEYQKMPKVTVQYDTIDKTLYEALLLDDAICSLPNVDDVTLKTSTETFLKECKIFTKNVAFDKIQRTEDMISVRYRNLVDGIPLESSYIIFTISDARIVSMDRYWLNPVELSDTKKSVIPASVALLRFMKEEESPDEKVVDEISMVYWVDSSSYEVESFVSDTAFPAWKISYNHGKISYIPAWEQ